jgi:hypothetical protein
MKLRISNSILLLIAVFSIIYLEGCSKDNNVNKAYRGHKAIVIMSDSLLTINGAKGNYNINIVTNEPVQVKTNSSDWINFPDTSGTIGSGKQWNKFTFSVTANTGDNERIGYITFKSQEEEKAKVKVIQKILGKNNIFVKENGKSSNKGYTWDNATSLKNALGSATKNDTIHVAEGTYSPKDGENTFKIDDNIVIIGGYPKNATNRKTKADPSKYSTMFSGENAPNSVITISAPVSKSGEIVLLKGIIISNGNSKSYGGGITIKGSNVKLEDCQVVKNNAFNGGAIHEENGSVLTIVRSKINNNKADSHTGGIDIRGGSKCNIYDSEIKSNHAGAVAGGIFCYNKSKLNIYNSVVANNKSKGYGGAAYVRQKSTSNLVNVIIANNNAGKSGGGIFVYANATLNVISSTIVKNSTDNKSGGIFLRNGENVAHIVNSIISGNEQKNNNKDVGVNSDSHPAPTFIASVIGSNVYNENGSQISGASFNFSTMMKSSGNGIYVPVGGNNPALKYGLSANTLINISKDLKPLVVKQDIISEDLSHSSRNNSTTMGAVAQ